MEAKLIERLEAAVARLETLSAGGISARGLPDSEVEVSSDPSILAFDDLKADYGDKVSAAAEKIGGQVLDVTKLVLEAFTVQKKLLIEIKQTQKPDMAGLVEFLKPLNEVILKVNAMTEGRRSDFFNHLKSAGDSLSALAWIAYTGKDCGMSMPIAHVEESWQMAEFYNNKVLVEYRNKDQNHVEWAKALKELYLPGLRDYVKSHYPLGPVWSASGKKASSTPLKAPPPGAPAPPPPPPASLFSSEPSQPSSSKPKQGMSAVFQEISGGNVSAGLKKVTADMKTKNRTDRTGVVSAGEKETRSSTSSFSKAGPPKLELQMGRKWSVENQIGRKNLVIDDCDAKQSVYIYGCKDSVLQIQGKVNNITIDKCTKMGVVFKDVVAACEVVNCNGVEVQCQGSAPTISVDNTSGCQLYLSKDSLGASITTAKSSEINVLVPTGPDGDWTTWVLKRTCYRLRLRHRLVFDRLLRAPLVIRILTQLEQDLTQTVVNVRVSNSTCALERWSILCRNSISMYLRMTSLKLLRSRTLELNLLQISAPLFFFKVLFFPWLRTCGVIFTSLVPFIELSSSHIF